MDVVPAAVQWGAPARTAPEVGVLLKSLGLFRL